MQIPAVNVGYTWGRRAGKTAQVLFETAVLVNREDVEVYIQVDTDAMAQRVTEWREHSVVEAKRRRIHLIHNTVATVTLPGDRDPTRRCYVINLSNAPAFYLTAIN